MITIKMMIKFSYNHLIIVALSFAHCSYVYGLCVNPLHLINPIGMAVFLTDSALNFIDFAKESKLCPKEPADISEWDNEKHASPDTWPGMIFFTPNTQEDFEIYYDKNSASFREEDIRKFMELGFNKDLPTVIYLHAFTQNPLSRWLRTVREIYVEQMKVSNGEPKVNLLFMDFKTMAKLGYAGTARWVPALGKIMAQFIDKLVEVSGLDPLKLHLISFSLGNHIAGMAGRSSTNTIGRITALDPAGWCFSERYDHSYTQYGLKPTDALQVDANHFDTDFLGSRVPVGTIDVYMNGGAAQPGCASGYEALFNSALAMSGLVKKSYGEGHSRAAIHSVYTVNEPCHQIAYECSSYEAFEAGECGECNENNDECFSTSIYGVQEIWSNWKAPRSFDHRKSMFIKTSAKAPFCVQHYQIKMKLRGHDEQDETVKQQLKKKFSAALKSSKPILKLYDHEYGQWFATSAGQMEHEAQDLVFTALVVDQDRAIIRDTHMARLYVEQTPRQMPLKDLLESVESIEVNYMSHVNHAQRVQHSVRLCPDGVDKDDEGLLWMKKCNA